MVVDLRPQSNKKPLAVKPNVNNFRPVDAVRVEKGGMVNLRKQAVLKKAVINKDVPLAIEKTEVKNAKKFNIGSMGEIFKRKIKFNPKKMAIVAVVVILGFGVLYENGYMRNIIFPFGLFDKVKTLIFGDNALRASDYKDGTILLIKPIATGVGDGRYEAGDIVEIRDGEELFKRFGDGEFLGYEEKSKLIPLYLAQKLTEEQKAELLASEYEQNSKRQDTITKKGTNSNNQNNFVMQERSASGVISSRDPRPTEQPFGRAIASLQDDNNIVNDVAGPLEADNASRAGEQSRDKSEDSGIARLAEVKAKQAPTARDGKNPPAPLSQGGKMTLRRQYGVDYTLVLSDKDILTIRQEKPLDKIPEVKFEEIINKDTKLSYSVMLERSVSVAIASRGLSQKSKVKSQNYNSKVKSDNFSPVILSGAKDPESCGSIAGSFGLRPQDDKGEWPSGLKFSH